MNYSVSNIVTYSDYYPFGMVMLGRNGNSGNYRYGYQGSEMDNEIKGKGNSHTTYFRQLDTRLNRWSSVDPKASSMPWQSPYVSMDNNPILFNDVLGDSIYHHMSSGSKNVVIVVLNSDEVSDKLQDAYINGLSIEGWDYVVTDIFSEAVDWVENNYSYASIDNVAFRSHSMTYLKRDGTGDILLNEDGTAQGFDKQSGFTFGPNNESLSGEDVINENPDDLNETNAMNSFRVLSNYIGNEGSVCFSACHYAVSAISGDDGNYKKISVDKAKLNAVGKILFMNDNLTFYFNTNYSSMHSHLTGKSSGIYSSPFYYTHNGKTEPNPLMFIVVKGGQMISGGTDVKLTPEGIEQMK